MKVIRAKYAGFCYGVSRASRLALRQDTNGDRPVFTLGPLMHNPQEVLRLANLGIQPKEQIDDCLGGKVLVRTHGICKEEKERAAALNVELIDATCPYVEIPRKHIEKFGRQERVVLLVGDQGHPEVRAILSYATGEDFVVSKPNEIPKLGRLKKIAILAQTTQSKQSFTQVVGAACDLYDDVVEVCTICEDAELRQNESRELAGSVDLMIVVGGRNSANTCRLFDICASVQPRSCHVEVLNEVKDIDFNNVEVIGITSGASTPDWIIAEIHEWLENDCS